jgi:hypothetical protein
LRKTKTIVIKATAYDRPNRDAGKHFLLTEMSAAHAEKWAARALLAIAQSGAEIPPEVLAMGVPAVLAMGVRSLMTMAFADAEPLLDEMMGCVQVVPDPKRPDIMRPLDDEDIEEVTTRLLLRSELVELHTGFSIAAVLSKLGQAATAPAPSSKPTRTSRKRSA